MKISNGAKELNLFLVILIAGLFIVGAVLYLNLKDIESHLLTSAIQSKAFSQKEKMLSLDNFAQCLTKKGVKFYGAAFDGHTQNQKEIFKESAKHLPYIECIKPGEKEMTPECQAAKIKAFPTWEFPKGKRVIGEISIEKLEKLSGCKLKK